MAESENLYTVFKCAVRSCKYHFKDGSVAYFTDGRYATKKKAEIDQLNDEIEHGHPHIYIDKDELTTNQAILDPMSALREKFFKEFQEQQEQNKLPDFGSTDKSAGAGAGMATSAVNIKAKLAASSDTKSE